MNHPEMTIQDIQIIVIQMMIPVQILVVVIVAAMIKKLVPLEGQGVQDKPSLR
ncbi:MULTISPECIES: hypothetical protein [Acinetobacter]|uniref:hypothetical protein n=1 Tax=Acinetobacter TaxID=469 RepID=UPI0012B655FC|nr:MULTISPECIES: hypothetical protein [Acinetobacter]MCU4393456.1 hypothetical protein [Acinetobacter parvus]MCU4612234.1 hypothetical protein [Acinetobacter parvus]